MFVWGRHHAALCRARQIIDFLGARLDRGPHLTVIREFNEPSLLMGLGVRLSSIVLVCSSEEALEVERHLPQLRIIADDLSGAIKDCRRRYTYAFYEAPGEGTLTTRAVDEFQQILSQGVATDGLAAISFTLNASEDEEEAPELVKIISEREVGADNPTLRSIDLTASLRVAALLQMNAWRFQTTTVWEPSHVFAWELPDGGCEAFAIGPVRRGRRAQTAVLGDRIFAPVTAATLASDEEGFKHRIVEFFERFNSTLADRDMTIATLAAVINIPFKEVSTWIK